MSTRVTPLVSFAIFGHRGSPQRFPENTPASFDEALRAGADGFETDLRLLADGTAILFHDDELRDREIESLDPVQMTESGAAVVPLDELTRYVGRTTMILEVKRSRWEDVLISRISRWSDIVIASFDHRLIADLSSRNMDTPLGLTTYGRIVDLASYAKRLGAGWIFPQYRYVDAEMVASLHEHGIRVVPWTPNRERDWQRLADCGCDGVITDLPEEAVAWRHGLEREEV